VVTETAAFAEPTIMTLATAATAAPFSSIFIGLAPQCVC
jgi:hypothetical protein